MIENPVISAYSKFDLRRLWPVVSTTLYPETEKRVKTTLENVRNIIALNHCDTDETFLLEALNRLIILFEKHYKDVEEIITQRLTAPPFGSKKFSKDYFTKGCDKLVLSRAEIRDEWNNIHTLARRCFGKPRSTPDEKLALARMNAVEQDVLYVLFVENHYMCPLVSKGTA